MDHSPTTRNRGFVQNLDTNPLSKELVITTARDAGATREGLDEDQGPDLDAAEAACLAACGEGMAPAARAAITATTAGYDLKLDVLPVIAERTAKPRGSPIRTWEYFSQAIAARHARRIAQAARPKGAVETGAGPAVAPSISEAASKGQGGIPEHLLRLAAWINSGSYVPPSAFTNTTRDALLRAGLVTEATLRARQIYWPEGGPIAPDTPRDRGSPRGSRLHPEEPAREGPPPAVTAIPGRRWFTTPNTPTATRPSDLCG